MSLHTIFLVNLNTGNKTFVVGFVNIFFFCIELSFCLKVNIYTFSSSLTNFTNSLPDTVVVKWDEEVPQPKIYFYKYEIENHEVEIIYEYRKINISIPGDIGTGCRVRRGK